MQRTMDKIQFESRREIEEVMKAIGKYIEANPKEKENEILKDFYNKLDMMHFEW